MSLSLFCHLIFMALILFFHNSVQFKEIHQISSICEELFAGYGYTLYISVLSNNSTSFDHSDLLLALNFEKNLDLCFPHPSLHFLKIHFFIRRYCENMKGNDFHAIWQKNILELGKKLSTALWKWAFSLEQIGLYIFMTWFIATINIPSFIRHLSLN